MAQFTCRTMAKINLTISHDDANIINAAVKKPKPIVTAGFVDLNSPIVRTVITNGIGNEIGLNQAISDWRRILRVTAYVVRFISNCRKRNRERKRIGQLTGQEILCAENLWLQYSQEEDFGNEMAGLRAHRELNKNSPLSRLAPFIDGYGLLRLSGRLQHAEMPYDTIRSY